MKVNSTFLQQLREKNINLDVVKFKEKLARSFSNDLTQASSSEFDQSQDPLQQVRSPKPKKQVVLLNTSTNFRLRPLTQSRQEPSESQLTLAQSQIHRKEDLSQSQSFGSPRKQQNHPIRAIHFPITPSGTPPNHSRQTSAASLFPKSISHSFYNDRPMTASERVFSSNLTGIAAHLQRKNSTDSNRIQSANSMTVSIYKDSEQNRLREDLLQYEEDDDEVVSYDEDDDAEDRFKQVSSEDENELPKDPFDVFLEQFENKNGADKEIGISDDELELKVAQEFISETITEESVVKIMNCSVEEFPLIRRATLRHDCTADSLQLFGELLPNLQELNMNDSVVNGLRDIGTSVRSLRVLILSRVRLHDLSGINAFPLLAEFYASYNQITDLGDLYFNESLEVLDLEGNNIAEIEAIDVLETLPKLKEVNLALNPLIQKFSNAIEYRKNAIQKIPGLKVLDDLPITVLEPKRNTEVIEEDFYENLKSLNWGQEKFLSQEFIAKLNESLKNELSEESLLLRQMKITSSKQPKKDEIQQQQQQQNVSNMKNSSIFGPSSVFSLAKSTHLGNSMMEQNTLKKPKSAVAKAKTSPKTNEMEQCSEEQTAENDEQFYGNRLKVLKQRRRNDFTNVNIFEENSGESELIPKNIVELLELFKHETNNEDISKLKDQLKMFDFMVEQQQESAKVKMRIRRPVIASFKKSAFTVPAIFNSSQVEKPKTPLKNGELNGLPEGLVRIGESETNDQLSKPNLVFKRQAIKLKIPSSPNPDQKVLLTKLIESKLSPPEQKGFKLPVSIQELRSRMIRSQIRPQIQLKANINLLVDQ